jgi:hypothetical protein
VNFFGIFGKIITKFITEAKDFCVFFGDQYKNLENQNLLLIFAVRNS